MKSNEIKKQIYDLENKLRELKEEHEYALIQECELKTGDKLTHVLCNDGYDYEEEYYMIISCFINDKRVYGLLDLDIFYVDDYYDTLDDIKSLVKDDSDWSIYKINDRY